MYESVCGACCLSYLVSGGWWVVRQWAHLARVLPMDLVFLPSHSNFVGKHRLPIATRSSTQPLPFHAVLSLSLVFLLSPSLLLLSLLLICHPSMSCNQVLLLAPILSNLLPTQPPNRGQNVWKMAISVEGSKE